MHFLIFLQDSQKFVDILKNELQALENVDTVSIVKFSKNYEFLCLKKSINDAIDIIASYTSDDTSDDMNPNVHLFDTIVKTTVKLQKFGNIPYECIIYSDPDTSGKNPRLAKIQISLLSKKGWSFKIFNIS